MRKTAYNKFKTLLKRANRVIIERHDDEVLLCEEHVLAQIPLADYETYFVSCGYPPLMDGFAINRIEKLYNFKFPYKSETLENIRHKYMQMDTTGAKFYKEVENINGQINKAFCFETASDKVVINKKFIDAVLPFMENPYFAGGNRRDPLFVHCSDYEKWVCIIPINYREIETEAA